MRSTTVLLASTTFAAGFALAWAIQSSRWPPPAAAPGGAAVAQQGGPPDGGARVASAPAVTSGGNAASPARAIAVESSGQAAKPRPADAETALRLQAEADPAVLRSLIHRYPSERNAATRDMLRSVLASIRRPEVIDFGTQLLASGDPALRGEALQLLQHLAPASPQARKAITGLLATEQSPELLVSALTALGTTAPSPDEAGSLLAQVRQLAQHADPAVRSQSLLQWAQWDKTGSAQASLTQALSDPSAEVRQSAIFAIAQSSGQSDAAKAALLAMATNAREDASLRGSALQALERYSLTRDEHALYSQARQQVLGF